MAESAPKSQVFAGANIGLSKTCDKSIGDLMGLIMDNGGKWCNISKTATHMLCREWEPARRDFQLSEKYGLPVVHESWLDDSIAAGKMQDTEAYIVPRDRKAAKAKFGHKAYKDNSAEAEAEAEDSSSTPAPSTRGKAKTNAKTSTTAKGKAKATAATAKATAKDQSASGESEGKSTRSRKRKPTGEKEEEEEEVEEAEEGEAAPRKKARAKPSAKGKAKAKAKEPSKGTRASKRGKQAVEEEEEEAPEEAKAHPPRDGDDGVAADPVLTHALGTCRAAVQSAVQSTKGAPAFPGGADGEYLFELVQEPVDIRIQRNATLLAVLTEYIEAVLKRNQVKPSGADTITVGRYKIPVALVPTERITATLRAELKRGVAALTEVLDDLLP